MEFVFTQQAYRQAVQHKQRLFIVVCGSILLNLLQGAERMMRSDKIVLVPSLLSSSSQDQLWIQGNKVSAGYLEEWALYLTNLLLNVSSHSLPYQSEIALRHISPAFASAMKAKFKKDHLKLSSNNAATTFFPKEIKVNVKEMKVLVKGSLTSFVGREKISIHEHEYELKFVLNSGRFLHLEGFKQVSLNNRKPLDTEDDLESIQS